MAGAKRETEPRLLPGARVFAPWLAMAALVLSFLGAVEMIGAAALVRSLAVWPARLAGSATLAVSANGIESAEAAAARAVEVLGRDPRIARAWILAPAPGDALAGRIMGAPVDGTGGAAPRLVGFEAKPDGVLTAEDVLSLLRAERIGAAADDHGFWSGPLERAALGAFGAAALLLVALAAVLSALAGWGVNRAFARSRERARLLLCLGARDEVIAQPLRGGHWAAVIVGVVAGTLAAAAAAAALLGAPATLAGLVPLGPGLSLSLSLSPGDLAAALAWPAAAMVIGLSAAAGAARRGLRSLT